MMLIQVVAALWIGGILGGATIALATDSQRNWTIAGGLFALLVWPAILFMVSIYLICGAKMGSIEK